MPFGGNISQQDRTIIVMGPTGAGKSTFIEHATGQDSRAVGHGWKSSPAGIRAVRVTHPIDGGPVVFVDTPGFDDTFKSNEKIVDIIAGWLRKTYKGNIDLTAILYLHRISDNRVSGSAMENLRLFSSLCGQQVMPNVVIVTTMWSDVPGEVGTKREEDLKRDVWTDMMPGCRIERFKDTCKSTWDIIDRQRNIVVVMGPASAGKSRFIECATKRDRYTANSWKSPTAEIQSVSATHPKDGYPVVFIDTPGFGDKIKSDREIVATIANWLMKTCRNNVNLAILYLNRISDDEIFRSPMEVLQFFSNLCGKPKPNVAIVTTMWSCIPNELEIERENALKQEMQKDRCRTQRFRGTSDSAWNIVGDVIGNN